MQRDEYNARRLASGDITIADIGLLIEYFQDAETLYTDGKLGPQTLARLRAPSGSVSRPKNRAQVYRTFGDPGSVVANPTWERVNIISCHSRGARPSLPGVPTKYWVQVHKLVEPMMRAALEAATKACPDYEIKRLGCHVYRHERHDPTRPLSLHSWGIAFDVDAPSNSAHYFSQSKPRPEPWSEEWTRLWPDGLPREWVEAVEQAGFVWGGRWTKYCDPMHFQFCD